MLILNGGFWILDKFSTGGQDLQEGGLRRSRCGGLLVTGGADFRFWILNGGF